jgi:ABC-type Fe3+ transport system substrate-binding protein
MLGGSAESALQGRNPDRQSQYIGHRLHDAGDTGADLGRGQGVRIPEGAAQERQPVRALGRGTDQGRGRGETAIGIVFLHDVAAEKSAGFNVVPVSPCEGTGYEIGSMSIIKGARNLDNAKKFYDWALTPDAQKLLAANKSFQLASNKATPQPPESPRFNDIKLIDYDLKKYGSATERKRLLAKWDKEVYGLPK